MLPGDFGGVGIGAHLALEEDVVALVDLDVLRPRLALHAHQGRVCDQIGDQVSVTRCVT